MRAFWAVLRSGLDRGIRWRLRQQVRHEIDIERALLNQALQQHRSEVQRDLLAICDDIARTQRAVAKLQSGLIGIDGISPAQTLNYRDPSNEPQQPEQQEKH